MKTEYLPTFIKDLKNLKSHQIYGKIKTLVTEEIPQYEKLTEINNLKKKK